MCIRYGGPVGGKPLDKPPKAGAPPPPDRVNNQEVAPQSDRKRLAAEAKAQYDKQEQPINWREIKPQDRGKQKSPRPILQEYVSLGTQPQFQDNKRALLKLNPDGSPAQGFGKEYYDNPDNWWSREDLGLPDLDYGDTDDNINI